MHTLKRYVALSSDIAVSEQVVLCDIRALTFRMILYHQLAEFVILEAILFIQNYPYLWSSIM